MALDSQALTTTCNSGMGPDVDDGDEKPEPPPTTGADGAEAETVVYKKGAWSKEEDEKLIRAVEEYGLRNWVTIEKFSGLARPAKNCRLRWLNYLRPNLKKYPFTEEEERLIIHLHAKHGNSWSRIASKLPGRSDNEIKNFWHKRAKKRQKQHLPLYPSRQELQQYQINENHCNGKPNAADYQYEDFTTNYHHPNIHNLSIHSPDSQNNSGFHPTSTYSPQTPIPTPRSQFQSSPSSSTYSPQTPIPTPQSQFQLSPSSIITSQKQSPTNDQTPLLSSSTPTSQPQNSLLSPHQSTENPLWQGSNVFTMLRKPPILSSPNAPLRRFSRATSHQLPPRANPGVSAFPPPQDSSLQMQWPSPVGSPRSPMNLKLSPGVPPVYSVQMGTQKTDSPVSSFSVFQSNAAPLSPLKLGKSTPVTPESRSQSNSIPESAVQLDSSTATEPISVGRESQLPSIQIYQQATAGANSSVHEAESYSNLEIMDELREAQERVKFLKRRLRQKKISKKRSLLTGSSTDLYRLCQIQNGQNSETGKDTSGIIESQKIARCENSETETSQAEILQREEDSQGKTFKVENSTKESWSGDLLDHINSQNTVKAPDADSWGNKLYPTQGSAANCLNECPTMEELLGQSSTLLQGDLFGQSSGLENPLSLSGHVPLVDAFGPVYSQSTATTLVKPVDEEFGYSLGREFSDEQNLLLNQYPAANLLDSRYLFSKQIMEQESSGGQQFYLQTSGGGNSAETSNHCEPTFLLHQSPVDSIIDSQYSLQTSTDELPRCGVGAESPATEIWKQESCPEQSLMNSSLIEGLWTQGQMVSQDQTFPSQRFDSDQTGEVLRQEQEHKYINAISNEDISSLLEFFPPTNQTVEWYSNGNAIPDAEAADELGLHTSSTSQPPITIADYLN